MMLCACAGAMGQAKPAVKSAAPVASRPFSVTCDELPFEYTAEGSNGHCGIGGGGGTSGFDTSDTSTCGNGSKDARGNCYPTDHSDGGTGKPVVTPASKPITCQQIFDKAVLACPRTAPAAGTYRAAAQKQLESCKTGQVKPAVNNPRVTAVAVRTCAAVHTDNLAYCGGVNEKLRPACMIRVKEADGMCAAQKP